MSDWVRVADSTAIAESTKSGATFFVDEHEVAIFRVDGKLRAIDGKCPHKGASLGNGSLKGDCVVCPWHAWEFDTTTGGSPTHSSSVRVLCVKEDGDGVWIDRDSINQTPPTSEPDGIHRYLIRYASPGWVGLFGTVHKLDCPRGSTVVVKTNRGEELGEVLSGPEESERQADDAKPTGEVVRLADSAEQSQHAEASSRLLDPLIESAQTHLEAESVDAQVVDAELLFDRKKAVLYYLGEASPVLADLREPLRKTIGIEEIEWASLIEPAGGCGSGGCGNGGCQT